MKMSFWGGAMLGLFIAAALLKIFGVIDRSWLYVMVPLWFPPVASLFLVLLIDFISFLLRGFKND